MHGHAKERLDDYIPFKQWLYFSIYLREGGRGVGGSQENYHLLILNMHGFHVTIEALEQATTFGFHMVDLLSLL